VEPQQATSLRDEHRNLTRTRILEAAGEVFAKRGYSATSTSDIVDAAGVSRGTFYLHFKNKAEVLVEVVTTAHFEPALELIARLGDIELTSPANLEPWLSEFVDLYCRTSPIVRAWIQGEGKEGAELTPVHDRFMAAFIDTMVLRIAALRSQLGQRADDGDLRLRALLIFVQLERFCYYLCIRHADFDPASGVKLLATTWYSVIAG
jgi:AcrR family transcriptional regulator